MLARDDARECLVTRDGATLGALAEGAGLAVLDDRAGLVVRAIRDDLDVQITPAAAQALAALDSGRVAGCLLGCTVLARLERSDEASQTFEEMAFLPPPGRGAVWLLVRDDDGDVEERLRDLDDPHAHAALIAELAFAEGTADGFATGAFGTVDGELLALRAMLGRPQDGRLWFGDAAGPLGDAGELGRGLAQRMRDEVES